MCVVHVVSVGKFGNWVKQVFSNNSNHLRACAEKSLYVKAVHLQCGITNGKVITSHPLQVKKSTEDCSVNKFKSRCKILVLLYFTKDRRF